MADQQLADQTKRASLDTVSDFWPTNVLLICDSVSLSCNTFPL